MIVKIKNKSYQVSWIYPGNCTCTCIIKRVHKTKEKSFIQEIGVHASVTTCFSKDEMRKESMKNALDRMLPGRENKDSKRKFWKSYAFMPETPRWTKM